MPPARRRHPRFFGHFLTVCLTVFPFEFRPLTFTIGFYGKIFHIRAYGFGVQFSFKGALSRYSVNLCRFFAVENGGEETRGRGVGQREAGLCRTFFLRQFRASWSIDVVVSVSCPCKVIPLSDEDGLWDKIKKVKTKRQVCPWKMEKNSWKPKQACWAPRIDLELSWSEDRSRLARLSGAVAYISLHSTMYTTTIDRQDTCWARFAWKDARPPLFFPTTKWRKNHWLAWQCTFKVIKRSLSEQILSTTEFNTNHLLLLLLLSVKATGQKPIEWASPEGLWAFEEPWMVVSIAHDVN